MIAEIPPSLFRWLEFGRVQLSSQVLPAEIRDRVRSATHVYEKVVISQFSTPSSDRLLVIVHVPTYLCQLISNCARWVIAFLPEKFENSFISLPKPRRVLPHKRRAFSEPFYLPEKPHYDTPNICNRSYNVSKDILGILFSMSSISEKSGTIPAGGHWWGKNSEPMEVSSARGGSCSTGARTMQTDMRYGGKGIDWLDLGGQR